MNRWLRWMAPLMVWGLAGCSGDDGGDEAPPVDQTQCRYSVRLAYAGAPQTGPTPIRVEVPALEGVGPGFDAVRFTLPSGPPPDGGVAEGAPLPFWRETGPEVEPAIFWVQLPELARGTAEFTLDLCDPARASASDGAAVFPIFEDFSGDLSAWVQTCEGAEGMCSFEIGAGPEPLDARIGARAVAISGQAGCAGGASLQGTLTRQATFPLGSWVLDVSERHAGQLNDACETGGDSSNLISVDGIEVRGLRCVHTECARCDLDWLSEITAPFGGTGEPREVTLGLRASACASGTAQFGRIIAIRDLPMTPEAEVVVDADIDARGCAPLMGCLRGCPAAGETPDAGMPEGDGGVQTPEACAADCRAAASGEAVMRSEAYLTCRADTDCEQGGACRGLCAETAEACFGPLGDPIDRPAPTSCAAIAECVQTCEGDEGCVITCFGQGNALSQSLYSDWDACAQMQMCAPTPMCQPACPEAGNACLMDR